MNETQVQKSTTKLTSIGVVFRHVLDVEAACDFYGNKLGMKRLWRAPDGATAFTTGSGPIVIVDARQERIESEAQFNFETPDISQAYRAMKENGVDVSDIKVVGDTSVFFFKDPDGNTMMIWACQLPDNDLPQYRE